MAAKGEGRVFGREKAHPSAFPLALGAPARRGRVQGSYALERAHIANLLWRD
jgi:hypothetical protein